MKKFTVYFEFLGKKQRIVIDANTSGEAQTILSRKLKIVKVREVQKADPMKDAEDMLNQFFKGFKK